jgi:hypothetical protein
MVLLIHRKEQNTKQLKGRKQNNKEDNKKMEKNSRITILLALDDYLLEMTKRKEDVKRLYKLNKNPEMLNVAIYWNVQEVRTKKAIEDFKRMRSLLCIG